MQENDPNEFWEVYNELCNMDKQNTNQDSPIKPEKWFNHFQTLMNQGCENINKQVVDQIETYISDNKNSTFNELDYTISEKEITNAISKLKNNMGQMALKVKCLNAVCL